MTFETFRFIKQVVVMAALIGISFVFLKEGGVF